MILNADENYVAVRKKNLMVLGGEIAKGGSLNKRVVMELKQYLLNIIRYTYYLGFLLKCGLWFCRSG